MSGHAIKLGQIIHQVGGRSANLLGQLVLLLDREVGEPVMKKAILISNFRSHQMVVVPKDKVAIDDPSRGVEELLSSLSQRSKGSRVESGCLRQALGHDIGQDLETLKDLQVTGQDVAKSSIQRGIPRDLSLLPT